MEARKLLGPVTSSAAEEDPKRILIASFPPQNSIDESMSALPAELLWIGGLR